MDDVQKTMLGGKKKKSQNKHKFQKDKTKQYNV